MPTINFSGLASGIDSNSLIDATSEAARATRVKPNQTKVSDLEDTNTAFGELKTKLQTLKDTLGEFTTLKGGGVSKVATSSKESSFTASASNGAVTGSYSLTVTTLATNHVLSFNPTYSSATAAIQSSLTGAEPAADRTVTFTIGSGSNQETVAIPVTNGSYSITDFVNAFNTASSKAEASLVNTGTATTPAYKVVITSNFEGTEKGLIVTSFSGSTALTNWSGAYTQQAAVDAVFSITGIGTITRPTNSIADVLTGVNISLVGTGTGVLKVTEDSATTKSKIQEFLDTYNDLITYVKENDQVTRDESGSEVKNVFAPLASTSIDEGLLTTLREAFSSTNYSSGIAVKILASMGITTNRDGTLNFNTTDFDSAISSEPTGVSGVLQTLSDRVATTNGTIDQFIRFNGNIDVALNGNKTLISDLNQRISEAEARIKKEADDMRARFARLESLTSKLQGQQNSLTSALSGLS